MEEMDLCQGKEIMNTNREAVRLGPDHFSSGEERERRPRRGIITRRGWYCRECEEEHSSSETHCPHIPE